MKYKFLIFSAFLLLFCSCYGPDRQAAGTMIGANLGGAVGGAIGRRSGGFAGDVFGTIVGTVAGAAIGNAVTAPRSPKERMEEYDNQYEEHYDATVEQRSPRYRGEKSGSMRARVRELSALKVKNLRFVDGNRNRIINADETCQLLFEVHNTGESTLRNITPEVYELNRMKHIRISNPSVISRIGPGESVMYTITIRTDRGLKEGTATFCIGLSDSEGTSVPCREFDIQTAR